MFVKDNQYPTLSELWTHNAVILESSTTLTDGFVSGKLSQFNSSAAHVN